MNNEEKLQKIGRDIGSAWLEKVVENSKDKSEFLEKLYILQMAITHTVAVMAFKFNNYTDCESSDDFINKISFRIKKELEIVVKGFEMVEVSIQPSVYSENIH